MAYGSPERVADVPAYYADIRGGRPIPPERLDDLVARYRALGIEDSNPLNAITEATRAALERELGLPVYTGMKHWTPRIADAVAARDRRWRDSARRARARTALQPAVDRRLPPPPRRGRRRARGGGVRRELARRSRASSRFLPTAFAARTRTSSSPRTRCRRASSTRATRTGTSCSRRRASSPSSAGIEEWSFSYQSESPTGEPWLGPDILDHLDDLAARGSSDVLVCPVGFVSDHLEIRWDIDTRRRSAQPSCGLTLERIEMPNDDPRFVEVLASIVRAHATA